MNLLLQVLTLLDKNLKPFAITSIALYNSNQLLREGYQKVEFYCSNGGKDVNCVFTVVDAHTIPFDCGYKEIDDYLKWEDMKGIIDLIIQFNRTFS